MPAEPTTEPRPPADAPNTGSPARPSPACPLCGVHLMVLSEHCQSCGGGLGPLLRVMEMADVYFNQAIAAAREEDWWQAAEHLAVTVALRPDDVDALVLLGKVRGRGKQSGLAVAACQEALRLAPDRADAKLVLERFSGQSRPHKRRR